MHIKLNEDKFGNNKTREKNGYNFSNPISKECFYSIDDCVKKGNKYIYLNNCFKYGCPNGTKYVDKSINSYKICYLTITPYLKEKTREVVDFCQIIQLLDNSCKIINTYGDFLIEITKNIENIIYNNTLLENEEHIIIGNNIIYEITTTKTKNKSNYNISFIDFGECEQIIKSFIKSIIYYFYNLI